MAKTKLSTYILLDRSCSMAGSKWENAIGAINSYVTELKKDSDITGEVTIAAFDSNNHSWINAQVSSLETNNVRFELLRNKQALSKFKQLAIDEVTPYGGTPLYDATALLLNMAELKPNEKTIILIMTDGEENQSKTYNLKSIKDRLACCTNRGWEVVFLGAEFNVDNLAANLGFDTKKFVSGVRSVNLGETMQMYASGAAMYAKTGAALDTTAMKAKFENK